MLLVCINSGFTVEKMIFDYFSDKLLICIDKFFQVVAKMNLISKSCVDKWTDRGHSGTDGPGRFAMSEKVPLVFHVSGKVPLFNLLKECSMSRAPPPQFKMHASDGPESG